MQLMEYYIHAQTLLLLVSWRCLTWSLGKGNCGPLLGGLTLVSFIRIHLLGFIY